MKHATLLLLLAFPLILSAQPVPDDAVIATVGEDPITAGEFRARYALGVFPYKDQERLAPVVRLQFLYSLIAERLLAAEARNRGFESEDLFRRNRDLAREMFMRDRLFRDSVRGAVTVTEEDIRQRYVEDQRNIQFEFLFSPLEESIRSLHRLLRAGVPFDTLLMAQQRDDPASQPRESARDASLEARLATLAPGEVSEPIDAADGWYIVRKMDYGNPFRSEDDLARRRKRIESQLRAEKEAEATRAFVARLWRGRRVTFTEDNYRAIGQALLEDYRAQAAADTSDLLFPSLRTFDSLRVLWSTRLEEPFLVWSADDAGEPGARTDALPAPMPLGQALDNLQKADLRLDADEIRLFPDRYRLRMRELADRWLLTQEAYRLGLDGHPDVLRDVGMWSAAGLAEMIPELLWEQFIANDDSLWNFYITRPDLFGPPVEVRIVEVLTRDEERMQEVVASFRSGADLHALAGEYSERPGAAERNGELGFFPVSDHGPIGRAAFGLRIADAAGPLSTSDGRSFFQLVDRRYPGLRFDGWSALRDTAEARAGAGLRLAKTEQLLRRLAARGGIRIDASTLGRIAVRSLQMFSIRHLGFGGRIPAVPGVAPLFEAVMEGMGERGDIIP